MKKRVFQTFIPDSRAPFDAFFIPPGEHPTKREIRRARRRRIQDCRARKKERRPLEHLGKS